MLLSVRYTARYLLLCDELKLGMSVDDVLGVLRQNGEVKVNKSEWLGGNIQLRINFTDPRGQAL